MYNSLKYIVFISLAVSACTKEINMEIPESERKLVVNGVFNVGEPVKVSVSKSKSMLEKSSIENVDNAEIKLFEDGEYVSNLDTIYQLWSFDYTYDEYNYKVDTIYRNIYYSKNRNVVQGKTYKLEVSSPGISKKAYVECTAPLPVPILKVDTITARTDEWTKYLHFELLINDPPGEDNFYIISLESKYIWTYFDEYGNQHSEFVTNIEYIETDDVILTNSNYDFENGIIFNDKLFNGKTQNIKFKKYFDYSGGVDTYYIILQSITKEYFNYLISSGLYQSGEGNPIAEPVSVISNVKDGFGIVTIINQWIDSSIVFERPSYY